MVEPAKTVLQATDQVIYIPPRWDAPKTRHRKVLEKHVEGALVDAVKSVLGVPYKFSSPNRRSVPDRMCVFPDGMIVFVECKAPGNKPTPAQYREMETLVSCHCCVCWLDTISAAHALVVQWLKTANVSQETVELNFL